MQCSGKLEGRRPTTYDRDVRIEELAEFLPSAAMTDEAPSMLFQAFGDMIEMRNSDRKHDPVCMQALTPFKPQCESAVARGKFGEQPFIDLGDKSSLEIERIIGEGRKCYRDVVVVVA